MTDISLVKIGCIGMSRKEFIVSVDNYREFKELYEKYTGMEVENIKYADYSSDYFLVIEVGKLRPKRYRDYYVDMRTDSRERMAMYLGV